MISMIFFCTADLDEENLFLDQHHWLQVAFVHAMFMYLDTKHTSFFPQFL
jgi:hypothetical protein